MKMRASRLASCSSSLLQASSIQSKLRHLHRYSTSSTTPRDVRIAFIGDSFVAGAGDADHRGWPSRLCAATQIQTGLDLTIYNLGIRRNTSSDILQRWEREVDARLQPSKGYMYEGRLVFSFGVNDCVLEDGKTRVDRETSLVNARTIMSSAVAKWPTVWIGLAPSTTFGDRELNERICRLEQDYQGISLSLGVPFLPLAQSLMHNEIWRDTATKGDGIHPDGQGYAVLAGEVERWHAWRKLLEA